MADEILDLVSEQDIVIGSLCRDEIYKRGLRNFRVINGFIINSENKLWIPRRHESKKLWPLHLDTSVGGHVSSQEDYHQAFASETQEELNINVNNINFKKLCKLSPYEHNVSAFMWVYLIYQNSVPNFNKEDFTEYYWLSMDKFFEKIKNGDKSKSDLPKILNIIRNQI